MKECKCEEFGIMPIKRCICQELILNPDDDKCEILKSGVIIMRNKSYVYL